MVLVLVGDRHDLQCRLLQCHLHRFGDLCTLCVRTSVNFLVQLDNIASLPVSVLGVANVTSNRQISQHISSSVFVPPVNHPKPPAFRRRLSKNCTPI